ncbi:MAG: hypothetical protein IPG22_14985 [Acidobacteria bacterium]|nr:hypothetical protein [Acidobacteriota bacterium]
MEAAASLLIFHTQAGSLRSAIQKSGSYAASSNTNILYYELTYKDGREKKVRV